MSASNVIRAVVTAATGAGLAACSTSGAAQVPVPTTASRPGTASAAPSLASGGPIAWRPMKDEYTRSVDPRGRRTDTQPLTSRFPAIGSPENVAWYSGTIGDGRVPGPSTYWIDAVVTLAPDVARAVVARAGGLRPTTVTVVDGLGPDLPQGPFTGSLGLDRALSGPDFMVRAALAPDGRTVVMRSTGGKH